MVMRALLACLTTLTIATLETRNSLGASLSTYAAFKFATDDRLSGYRMKRDGITLKPVVCISLASPLVGDQTWADAFKVSNSTDHRIKKTEARGHWDDRIELILSFRCYYII
jgi:hypothetical protein